MTAAFQYYFRVLIGMKDQQEASDYDVADFSSMRLAESYINNIVRKHPKWNDITMRARIARMNCEDDHLGETIDRILEESRMKQPSL